MDQDLNKVHTLQLADIFLHSLFIYIFPLISFFYLEIYFLKKSGHWLLVKAKRAGAQPCQSLEAGTQDSAPLLAPPFTK